MGAVILLSVGWVLGRLLGKGVVKLLQKTGIADVLRKTVVGKALDRSGISSARFLELLTRWFVYLIAILAAVDVLKLTSLSAFMSNIVAYLPNFIAGVLILFVGLAVVDFVGDAVRAIGREAKIEFAYVISVFVKLFLYLAVIVIALTTMRIDVTILNEMAKAVAWGTAIGIAVGLGIAFGWGLKDRIARDIDKLLTSAETTARTAEDFWSWYSRKEEKESA